ncbi:MAG: FlgD immunoglobulin-like domain containing protein [Candidatus Neomarinimicrobiota bacterium]
MLQSIAVILGISINTSRASHPITVDGLFDDWSEISVASYDPTGDNLLEDFAELSITNDNNFLFLNVSFHDGEHLIQDSNEIRLYIDTDNNSETGTPIHGIGAELEWCFGCRQGFYHTTGGSDTIYQNDLTLRTPPTITSERFEIAIGRNTSVMSLYGIQTVDTVSVLFKESDPNGDILPNQTGGIQYVFDTTSVDPPDPISLWRYNEGDIRIVTYNTYRSGLLDEERQPRFERILTALDPDIIAFQEQYEDGTLDSLMSDWLPDKPWYSSGLYRGQLIVLSKYPILQEDTLISSERIHAVLLDTEQELGSELLIINNHLNCCTNDSSRQADADEFVQVMREWRQGDGPFPLADGTPFVHLGDFNLVGYRQQLKTLRDGDISDEATHGGEDFPLDWDGTSLTDLFSRHTHIRMGYTWRDDASSFSPGKLDYILYTDSVIDSGKHFVLNTLAMDEVDLLSYGLRVEDTQLASDHLPRVMDVAVIHPVGTYNEVGTEMPVRFELYSAYPNPFNPVTTLKYDLPARADVTLTIYDILGRQIRTLVQGVEEPGYKSVVWDGTNDLGQQVSAGVYLYRIEASDFTQTRKMLLIK